MSGAAEPDYEQEIRFAVVLYGGVSLAIYINGIAQELLRMVRATAVLPQDEKLKGTERIYRELGQILGLDGPLQPSGPIDPENTQANPIRSRFVVDIISGTSAGGINGVALAKALALKCRDLTPLRKTWLDEAQLDLLLNDKQSDPRKYPPHQGKKTTSLLNSERMYGKILETLVAMNQDRLRTKGDKPFADKIDLFVTATDLAGLEAPIQLTAQTISERVHKRVFHFEYPSPTDEENQFDSEHDPMLAFAARCTSSFPVAFEPMRFDRIETQIKAQLGLTLEQAKTRFEEFFPAYLTKSDVDYWSRQFADGGYLDNRPFSYVTELIPYRSATRPSKRKLLFVDPFPELHGQKSNAQQEISFVENAMLAAMTLPRYEVIRGDIQMINTYNRRLERLSSLKKRDQTDREKLTTKPPLKSPEHFAALDLKAMVETEHYGEFYPRYHHLRVYDTTDELARLVTRLAGYEPESDEYSFLRRLLRAWREEHYDAYAENGKQTENAFLDRFDIYYRLRRLNNVRSRIDETLSDSKRRLTPSAIETLWDVRRSTEVQLKRLREEIAHLGAPTRSPLLEEHESRRSISELRHRLPNYFQYVMNEPDQEARADKAKKTYQNKEIQPHVDAIMNSIGQRLEAVFEMNSQEMQAVLPPELKPRPPNVVEDIHEAYYLFHWHDLLSLSFLEGSGAREYAEIEIYRVSPADSELVPLYVKQGDEKLVGTAVGAFGGFLQREWRAHDMMWGRLDGAERIITALLPSPDHADLRRQYIDKAQDVILQEEFSLAVPDNRDRIFYWLAQKLRDKNVTDVSADDLVKRGQKLLENFPSLADLVSRKDFRAFLTQYYSPPPPPEPDLVADWSGRSFKILGRMIDDLPEGRLSGVRGRVAGASRSAGVLLTNLLHFATPGSIGKRLLEHLLALIAFAGVLLIAAGLVLGGQNVAWVGYGVLLACLAAWLLSRAFGNWVKGKTPLRHPVKVVLVVLLTILIPLGVLKLWELLSEWKLVSGEYDWASRLLSSLF